MSQLQALQDWTAWSVCAAFWISVAFPPVTALFWDWWDSVWGWNIVSLDFCLAGLLLRPTLHVMFGAGVSPGNIFWAWEEAVLITAISVIIVWRAAVIYLTQRTGAAKDPKDKESPPVGLPKCR